MKAMPPASTPLIVKKVRDATVMPLTPHAHRRPETYEFGVFTRRGRIVRKSLLLRNYGRQGFPAEFVPASRTEPRTAIFVGHLVDTFGHFLLEGLSRLWYAKAHPELPIAWVGWAAEPVPSYRRWQRELLDVLGIQNEAIFLNEPTRFKSVHVPQAGYRIKDWCSDRHADFLAVYPKRPRDPALKLWLSRAEVNAGIGSTFAHRLDRQLAEHGWSIVRPEKLHIREQLELLASASRVAGEEGSAFHSLALLSDVSGLEVDIIGRFPDRAVEGQNQNYQTVANATGLQQRMHCVPEERMLFTRERIVRKVATTIAGHLEIAGVTRPTTAATAAPPQAARSLLSRVVVAVAATAYLEVGADPGEPNPEPAAPVRDIVRPAFATDPRRHDVAGQHLFEMPPDEYFDYIADPERPYDVIYLDVPGAPGLLWRWFVASRRYAHAATVWVLRETDERMLAGLGPVLRSTTVTMPDGPCALLFGPAADAAAVEEATKR